MNCLSALKAVPLLLFLAACSLDASNRKVISAKSPDRDLSVEVIASAPSSSFGPHPVRIYVTKESQRDLLIRTPVFNDGKALTAQNAEIQFEAETIKVCLKGTANSAKQITFNSDTRDYQVTDGSCE